MKRNNTKRTALCGILAAMALAVMFMGGVIPFASIACPVLASLIMIPVYAECGKTWGWIWFMAVAILAAFMAPVKESAVLFVFFGYYPMLKKYFNRLKPLKYVLKFVYLNATVFVAYWLMLRVFELTDVSKDFEGVQTWMLGLMLVLANISFFIYDLLIDRIEILYHVRLRPKLKL
ncbi:MAG: hypothetical protein E7434_07740 [Ruminococcaceae bacterium]|nr:hypothetical protein [Oscillospiraceae bacterium]